MNRTFDNFIVGKTNELAYSLAKNIANDFNTGIANIFIYGESGVGKTHLLRAIENEVAKLQREKKIIYTTVQAFVDELVSNIRIGSVDSFRKKYSSIDYLLIDGAEQIDGKEQTQSELINIIDTLSCLGTKIAITAHCTSEYAWYESAT